MGYTPDEIARIDYCRFEHHCPSCPWRESCSEWKKQQEEQVTGDGDALFRTVRDTPPNEAQIRGVR